MNTLVIATRRTPLALAQSRLVGEALRARHPGLAVEYLELVTRGDQILDRPLYRVGGKALFVKELETALLDGRAHLAVHSLKDVPMVLPEALCLPVILARGPVYDAFVSDRYPAPSALPPGARIGSSSLRRACLLRHAFPQVEVVSLRGSVGRRLERLEAGEFDAVVLAAAGLERLGLADRIRDCLWPQTFTPAAGQGALALECRRDDAATQRLIAPLHDPATAAAAAAERAVVRRLDAGCQLPVGAWAHPEGGLLRLAAFVGRPDGSTLIRGEVRGAPEQAEAMGTALAEDLLRRGADRILAELGGDGGR